jgi:glycosyltransferase involved in cell wall biosynthesis
MDLNCYLGPTSTDTGYGAVIHEVYKNMIFNHGVNLRPLNPSVYITDFNKCEDWFKQFITNYDGKKIPVYKRCISINYPTCLASLEGQQSYSFSMFENERLPKQIVKCLNNQDVIIVPCEHNIRTFKESGVIRPIFKVPLGNDNRKYHYMNRNWDISDDNPYVLCHFGHVNWRKGGDLAMKAFKKVFPPDKKDVRLIMKISKQYTPPWMIPSMRTSDERIHIVKEHLSDTEMLNLYGSAHCMVAPTRGDAWNLLAFQALATGCPSITTTYCGPEEYKDLTFPLNWKLKYCEEKVFGEDWGYYGEPDFDHLCELMEYAYNNPGICRLKGIEASNSIKENYTWNHTAKKILDVIEKTS